MGQKVNPVLFRLGTSTSVVSSWSASTQFYSHFLYQDLELKKFLSNVLRSRGILLRSCRVERSSDRLLIDLDIFFSYILTKRAKFFWARSLFKTVKKKYLKIDRIRDLKNFVKILYGVDLEDRHELKKKYLLHKNHQHKFFSFCGKNGLKKSILTFKNRLFFFLILKKRGNLKKDDTKLLGVEKYE